MLGKNEDEGTASRRTKDPFSYEVGVRPFFGCLKKYKKK